ncbi:23S rRNA (cytidine1920-2'-O)/16S rRNA (cytidine1409-2'-O)-methyltransferase [Pilibacter termitis]|uniref:23S rRNA (Cytidine1920-2'-O)/16S rRNA (Cytidine1409-2'-O)-methyltransferase n=1 Tax=Pilibacter termitis TaxID=263852 RepID=A0A1T4NRK5_9ENTE|nr:TlyA family RNA methyltransferase [Pilibacter termitis]SJZ81900.1 23S rRNA (cytidine1920-2'-O)/16S rRNA (cytidine1409-2'-O)-methyltransferase [Pilibacter termitis]
MPKERVDILATRSGLFETREKAKRAIMAGLLVNAKNGERFDKPGEKVPTDTEFRVKGEVLPYVSRGGLKLAKALEKFDLEITDKIVLDIGASTGGFTDVSLQNGARLVYALDVGTNQLAWKLRQDSRVVVMEQTNFRYAKSTDFLEGLPNFATIDVSFISLSLILPTLFDILVENGDVVALIKPQFEAGKENVGKNGIVRDKKVHIEVIQRVLNLACELGFDVRNLDFSPITTGGQGNIEFLAHLKKTSHQAMIAPEIEVASLVNIAHDTLS